LPQRLQSLIVIGIIAFLALVRLTSGPVEPSQAVAPVPTPQPTPTLTPDLEAIYRSQINPWFRDVQAWAENLEHEFIVPSADRPAAFAALEQRAIDLLAQLKTIKPSPNHVETHEHLVGSMQSCVNAISYYRNGDESSGEIYGGTCTIGLTLTLDVLQRD
jgi:hypothetical protein